MAAGVPVIAVDQGGVALLVQADRGVRSATSGPPRTVAGLADAIKRLPANPQLRHELDRIAYARTQRWPGKAKAMPRLHAGLVEAG